MAEHFWKYSVAIDGLTLATIPDVWLKKRMDKFQEGGFISGSPVDQDVTIFYTNNPDMAMFLIQLSDGGVKAVEYMEEALGVNV